MTQTKPGFKKIALAAANLADSKKAESIVIYDMAGRSELADYIVAVTVDSPAQLEAVDDAISIKLKQDGVYALYKDGARSKNWKVMDYGGVIVHIFEREARALYSLDKIFDGFKQLAWSPAAPQPAAKPAAAPLPAAAPKKAGKPAVKKTRAAALKKPKKAAPAGARKKAAAKKAKPKKKASKKK